jgi:ankyrin repeat protein
MIYFFSKQTLIKLCKNGNGPKILEYIEKPNTKYYPEETDELGNTPLMLACRFKLNDVALKLIEKFGLDCKPEKFNKNRNTALIIACLNKLDNVAIKIIEMYGEKCLPEYITQFDNTALIISNYCKLENVSNKLIDTFGIKCLPGQINKTGNTALIYAIKQNLKSVSEKLIDKFEYNVTPCKLSDDNKTVFQIACENNMQNTAIKLLQKFGMDCNSDHIDNTGFTLLEIAIKNRLENVAIEIIDLNINIFCSTNAEKIKNVLNIFCDNYMEISLIYFINRFVSIPESKFIEIFGKDLFLLACKNKLKDVMLILIDLIGDNSLLYYKEKYKCELLLFAYQSEFEDIIIKLMDKFPNETFAVLQTLNFSIYNTALNYTLNKNMKKLSMKLINSYGISCKPNLCTIANYTPLMLSIFNNYEIIADNLIEQFGDKCNLDQFDINNKNTALLLACKMNYKNIIIKLINKFGDKCLLTHKNREGFDLIYYIRNNSSLMDIEEKLTKKIVKKAYNYDDDKCIICMGELEDKCIMITPCGHSCYCNDCSIIVGKCSICNSNIIDRFEIPCIKK